VPRTEWLATFADPIRVQSSIDRFTSTAYDLVIDGESAAAEPRLPKEPKEGDDDSGAALADSGPS
jgi:hypothetical protein